MRLGALNDDGFYYFITVSRSHETGKHRPTSSYRAGLVCNQPMTVAHQQIYLLYASSSPSSSSPSSSVS